MEVGVKMQNGTKLQSYKVGEDSVFLEYVKSLIQLTCIIQPFVID